MRPVIYLTLFLLFAGCQQTSTTSEKEKETKIRSNTTITMHVEGMTCSGCEKTIENNIQGIQGVVAVKADHEKGLTKVTFDSTVTNKSDFANKIQSSGYKIVNK